MDEMADDPPPSSTSDHLQPGLVGRRVRLRAVNPSDYELLRRVELSPHLIQRWRSQGATPGMTEWVRRTEEGALVQLLIVDDRDGTEEWVGLARAYNADFQHGYAYLAVTKLGVADSSTKIVEGVVLFLDHLFRTWDLRKLYLETPAYNLDQFASGTGRLLDEEARLRDHWYYDGRYWDHVVLSIWRERWDERGPRLLRSAVGFDTTVAPQADQEDGT